MDIEIPPIIYKHLTPVEMMNVKRVKFATMDMWVTNLTDLSLLLCSMTLFFFPLLLQLFPFNLQLCMLHLHLPHLNLQLCHFLSPLLEICLGLLQRHFSPTDPWLKLLNLLLPVPQTVLDFLLSGCLRSQHFLQLQILFLLTCKFFWQALWEQDITCVPVAMTFGNHQSIKDMPVSGFEINKKI